MIRRLACFGIVLILFGCSGQGHTVLGQQGDAAHVVGPHHVLHLARAALPDDAFLAHVEEGHLVVCPRQHLAVGGGEQIIRRPDLGQHLQDVVVLVAQHHLRPMTKK